MASPDEGPRPGLDGSGTKPPAPDPRRRWLLIGLALVVVAIFAITAGLHSTKSQTLTYSEFLTQASHQQIKTAIVNNSDGTITGQLTSGASYTTNGPVPANQA